MLFVVALFVVVVLLLFVVVVFVVVVVVVVVVDVGTGVAVGVGVDVGVDVEQTELPELGSRGHAPAIPAIAPVAGNASARAIANVRLSLMR